MICVDFVENALFASLESFADSKLLDFSDLGQLTFRMNRTLGVSCYIRHKPNSYTHARGLRRRVQGPYG